MHDASPVAHGRHRPKKRTSSARRDKRRATHKAGKARLNRCPRCHARAFRTAFARPAATYAGREVVATRSSTDDGRPPTPRSNAGRRTGATVALDGFGAEQGFDALAEGARARRRRRHRGPGLRADGQLGLDGVEGVEVIATEESDRQRRGSGSGGPLAAARHPSFAPPATWPRARRRRWSATARPGRRWPRRPSGCGACAGVQRPALSVQLPVPGSPVLFLDIGANIDVRAQHLVQFAFLGAAFSEAVLGVAAPAVGLLSVGEEAGKGQRGGRRGARHARRGARRSTSSATSRVATCLPGAPTWSSPTDSPGTSR